MGGAIGSSNRPGMIADANGNGFVDLYDLNQTPEVGMGAAISSTLDIVNNTQGLRALMVGGVHGLDTDLFIVNLIMMLKNQGKNPVMCLEIDGSYIEDEFNAVKDLSPQNLEAIMSAGGDPTGLSSDVRRAFEKLHKANVAMRESVNEGDESFDSQYTRIESQKLLFMAAFSKTFDVPVLFFDYLKKNDVHQVPDDKGQVTPYRDGLQAQKVCEDENARADDGAPAPLYVFDTGRVHAANYVLAGDPLQMAAGIADDRKPLAGQLRGLFQDPAAVATIGVIAGRDRMSRPDVTKDVQRVNLHPIIGADPTKTEDNYPINLYDHYLHLDVYK